MSPSAPSTATMSALPLRRDPEPAMAALPGAAGGLLVLALLAGAAVFVVRKRLVHWTPPGTAPAERVRVVASRRLGPRAQLHVVEFGGREHLLAQTEHGIRALAEAPLEPRP